MANQLQAARQAALARAQAQDVRPAELTRGQRALAFFRSIRNAATGAYRFAAPRLASAASGAGTGAQVLMWRGIAHAVKIPPALAGAYEGVKAWGSDLDERRIAAAKNAWKRQVILRTNSTTANAEKRRKDALCRAAQDFFLSDAFKSEFPDPDDRFRKTILFLFLAHDIQLEDVDFTTASDEDIEASLQSFLAAHPDKQVDFETIQIIIDCLIPIAEEETNRIIQEEREYRRERNSRSRRAASRGRHARRNHRSYRNHSRSRNRRRERERERERERDSERRGRRDSRSRSDSSRNSSEERGRGVHHSRRHPRGRSPLYGPNGRRVSRETYDELYPNV